MNSGSTTRDRPLPWLRRAEQWTAAGLVAVILAVMAAQVVARYGLGAPIPWSEEVACFAFVWLAFLGGALVAGEGKLLTVDLISSTLGRRGRLAVECLSAAAVVVCCLLMVVGSEPFVRRLGGIVSPAAGIPRRWWYLASAVGLSLIALHVVVNAAIAVQHGTTAWADSDRDPEDVVPRSDLP